MGVQQPLVIREHLPFPMQVLPTVITAVSSSVPPSCAIAALGKFVLPVPGRIAKTTTISLNKKHNELAPKNVSYLRHESPVGVALLNQQLRSTAAVGQFLLHSSAKLLEKICQRSRLRRRYDKLYTSC